MNRFAGPAIANRCACSTGLRPKVPWSVAIVSIPQVFEHIAGELASAAYYTEEDSFSNRFGGEGCPVKIRTSPSPQDRF